MPKKTHPGRERRSIWVSIYIDPFWEGKVRARREKIVSAAVGGRGHESDGGNFACLNRFSGLVKFVGLI
jgi:hypothetical protein